MPTTKRWKQFHRIYAILAILWAVYLALLLPIQLRHRAETRLSERLASCTHLTPDHKITYDGECMDLAEHLYVIDKTAGSYSSIFPTLILAALGIPAVIYGIIVIPAIVLPHLRRARPNNPPQSDPA